MGSNTMKMRVSVPGANPMVIWPGFIARRLTSQFNGAVQVPQHGSRLFQKDPSGLGQLDVAFVPLEQGRADDLLQLTDLPA